MKNKKTILHAVAISLIIIVFTLSLSFIKSSFIVDATTKTSGYFVNDVFDSPSQILKNNTVFQQDFTANGDIYGVKIRFNNNATPQKGSMLVQVYKKDGKEPLLEKTVNSETLLNDAYTAINFDTPYHSDIKEEYTLKLTPNYQSQNATMAIWQDSEKGNIAMGIISRVAEGGKIFAWYKILSVVTIIAAVLVYLACFVFKFKKETAFVICLLAISVIFNMVLPPYSSPDEEAHINSAYLLSNKIFDQNLPKEQLANSTVYKRIEDQNEIIKDRYTSVFSYEHIYDNFFKTSEDKNLYPEEKAWTVGDFPAVYLLGAIAIEIGRILNLGFVPMLYLGRLFNLAFFALSAYFAVKITPIGKEIFMLLSFLPITLHLTNSFSRDAFVISISFIFIAYLLYLLFEKQDFNIKHILLLALMGILLAPSKMIYVFVCTLPLLLIKKHIKLPKINNIPKKYLLAIGTVILLAFSAIVFFILQYGQYFTMMFSAPASFEQLLQQNPDATYNLALILQNPMVTAKLMLNTLFCNATYYIKSIVGGVLGYNSIIISDSFIFIFLILLFVCTFKTKQEKHRLSPVQKTSFLAVFAVVFLIVIYLGLSWTPIVDKTIYGIQGKYLLPVLPLLFIAIKNEIFVIKKDIFKYICFIAATTNIFVALNALVIIAQR